MRAQIGGRGATTQTEYSLSSGETLAAYIDGCLDGKTRKRVVEHMEECAPCFDIVMAKGDIATNHETVISTYLRLDSKLWSDEAHQHLQRRRYLNEGGVTRAT